MQAKSVATAMFLLSVFSLAVVGQTSLNEKDQIAQHERMAQQYDQEKRPDLAIPEWQKVVALDPNNLVARANLGVLLFFRGDYSEATPQLQAAIALQPNLWKVRTLLGLAEEHTGNIDDARKDLEASFPMIEDKKLKIEVGLDLVGLYTSSSELDKAAGLVSQLKIAYPDVPEVLYAAYRTYADLSGESMLSLSLSAPDSAQMHQLLAHEEIRQGNTNGAIEEFHKAIAIDPKYGLPHTNLGVVLKDQGHTDEAIAEYRKAIAIDPKLALPHNNLGVVLKDQGYADEAIPEYRKAIAIDPKYASPHAESPDTPPPHLPATSVLALKRSRSSNSVIPAQAAI